MSLKAKLEAVIYAAEEPVTLAQLAMLFAGEALEWKAEQEAAARAAKEAAETPAAELAELPLMAEAEPPQAAGESQAEAPGLESNGLPPDGAIAEPEAAEQEGADAGQLERDAPATEMAETAEQDAAVAAQDSAAGEAEIRRAARQREREVRAILREILDEIVASYAAGNRGVEIREIAGGYRMATKPECHDAVRLFVKSLKPALKLSLPALETLAVIAYKQPVTAPEVNEIRGVDSSGVFGSLLARKLIATAGRKQVIGRPILYKTTKEFLLRFGLKDISELPSMEEFEKMAASELADMEPATAETNHAAAAEAAAPEFDETAREDEEDVSGADSDLNPTPQSSTGPPEVQSESNPSETARLNAESSSE